MKLSGKIAIVTGSTHGIGKGIGMKFASEGASVVVVSRHLEQAQEVADEIKKRGSVATAFQADVANRAQVNDLVSYTLETYKAIHILVNNAGTIRPVPVSKETEEDWETVINTDLKGVFNCTQAVLGHLMQQRYGKIINITSVMGVGVPGPASYGASKAGIVQLTKNTAMEVGPYGINVNAIAPGFIIPGGLDQHLTPEEIEKAIESRRKAAALDRVGSPEDIANLAVFLASDDSSFITGQVIRCDGGRHDLM